MRLQLTKTKDKVFGRPRYKVLVELGIRPTIFQTEMIYLSSVDESSKRCNCIHLLKQL